MPGITNNLLSVCKLNKNGFKVIFENGKASIIFENEVVAVAQINSMGLYTLNLHPDSALALAAAEIETWQQRTGHLNYDSLKSLSRLVEGMDIKGNKKPEGVCEVCTKGKQTKLLHNQTRHRATRPLQLVHSDIMGPINITSYDGRRYILTFVDDFTHSTIIYLMENKSEVLKHFQTYEAMVTAYFYSKISRFCCDNEKDYISNDIIELFRLKGIHHEYTIRYTPELNGFAERMNRSICDKARCLLMNSKLQKEF